jgi:hypothetical protein
MAYVDLSKRQNIIVGEDKQPHLIDFQVCFLLPRRWPGNSRPVRALLKLLQGLDDYHVLKHQAWIRPLSLRDGPLGLTRKRPWMIRLSHLVGDPLRRTRRSLLVLLGVRRGKGRATTEAAPEDAVRRELAR